MPKLEVMQPSYGMDSVTANHSYLLKITLEPISFLYLYHLTYVNKLRYQASESKNGVGNDLFGKNRRSNFCDILSAWLKAKVLFAMSTANLQLFGDQRECPIHSKKWHKMRDKRPLFVARCSQPTKSGFFLGCTELKFGYFSQLTVFVWKCNMTLLWDLRNLLGIKDETSVNLEISSEATTH